MSSPGQNIGGTCPPDPPTIAAPEYGVQDTLATLLITDHISSHCCLLLTCLNSYLNRYCYSSLVE